MSYQEAGSTRAGASIQATKGLYRRVEALLDGLRGREEGQAFLAATLRALFEAFGSALRMRTAELLVREGGALRLVERCGAPATSEPAFGIGVEPPSARVHRSEGGPGGARAAFELVEAERTHVFAFRFEETWDPDAVELVLNTASSILWVKRGEERLDAVLRQAAEIQQSLLPPGVPAFSGFELAARSLPAEEVGGDWFDFLPLGEGTLGISIGDASGHGLPAALMARDVVVGLRMGIEKELRVDHVLAKLNRVLHRSTLSSCFASLLFGELEENGSFFYYSAGHDAPLLLDARGCASLRTGGPVLGPLPEVRLQRHFAHVDHGATLVLYTDGLIERRSPAGELFGLARLKETLLEGRALGAPALLEHVLARVESFAGAAGGRDDETLVLVRRLA